MMKSKKLLFFPIILTLLTLIALCSGCVSYDNSSRLNNLNLTNMTGTGLVRIGFQPYLDLLGNAFWGVLFGFPAAAIYVNAERKYMGVFGYLTLIGLFFTAILPFPIAAFFGLILTFIVTTILYKSLVEVRS